MLDMGNRQKRIPDCYEEDWHYQERSLFEVSQKVSCLRSHQNKAVSMQGGRQRGRKGYSPSHRGKVRAVTNRCQTQASVNFISSPLVKEISSRVEALPPYLVNHTEL